MENIEVLGIDKFQEGSVPEFYVNRMSRHLATSHMHINRPHKHDFYAAILFTRGTGTHDIDFARYDVNTGSVYLLAPGQTHSWKLSDDAEGFIFFHTREYYDMQYAADSVRDFPFFSSLQNPRHINLSPTQLGIVEPLFKRILFESAEGKYKSKMMILSLITQCYIELVRMIANGESGTSKPGLYLNKFSEFERLVEEYFLVQKSAEYYARSLNITTKHLNRICKAVVNKTTSEIIIDRVMLEARRMLVYADSTFTEIAYALGYDDYAYFSRLFKQKTGETPGMFRNKYK
jgi:AraC family transcriptional activator of pobA